MIIEKAFRYPNGIGFKLKNKRITTIKLDDGSIQFEILTHANKEEIQSNKPLWFCNNALYKNKVMLGTMRLSQESALALFVQLAEILEIQKYE